MATKREPGKYDCYANAGEDEPIFTLRSTDPSAEFLVAAWVALRARDLDSATRLMRDAMAELDKENKPRLSYTDDKAVEAQQCAKAMRVWRIDKKLDAIEKRLTGSRPQPEAERE